MAIKYIPFFPEPIEGQALLDNFKRTLKYKGAYDVADKLRRGMPLYEMETEETVGENKDGNLVIRGECVSACAYLREKNIKVDLVYIDPPFASGADYAKKIYIRRNPKVAEAIAKAEEELENDAFKEFEDKMYGDVWDKEKYLNWMYENLMAIKSVMSETASIYVHLDWHIGHYVKILMDEIFGEDNFINEIVWGYKDISAKAVPYFKKKHDTIFLYQITESRVFNIQRQPLSESTLKRYGDYFDENGIISYQWLKYNNPGVFKKLKGHPTDLNRVNQKIDEFNQKALHNSSEKKPYKPIVISNEGLELIEYISLDCTNAEGVWHSYSEIKIDKLGYVIVNGKKTKEFWDGTISCAKKPMRLKVRNICGDESKWDVKGIVK